MPHTEQHIHTYKFKFKPETYLSKHYYTHFTKQQVRVKRGKLSTFG